MPEPVPPADEIEPWVTVQLQPAPAGVDFAAFLEPKKDDPKRFKVIVRPVSFYALQHCAFEDDAGSAGAEEVESRIVPVVILGDGTAIYLDSGRAGGPDHGFVGVAGASADAQDLGLAVLEELEGGNNPPAAPEAQP